VGGFIVITTTFGIVAILEKEVFYSNSNEASSNTGKMKRLSTFMFFTW
jgi:hypothetical protein